VSFLPPSTNADYEGAVIAGIDLSGNGAAVIGVFAWAGATQIVWGTALLVASLRYRSLVPPLLALLLLERALIALNLWLLKASASGHHPPEAYATLVSLPLLLGALSLSLRGRRPPEAIS
jgi:hypothetical protein